MPTQCVSVDFDGVLHRYSKGWLDGDIYDVVDVELIHRLHKARYAVAVSTCRPARQVGLCLKDLGIPVQIDHDRRLTFWSNPTVVLVTNMKVAAVAYIDDRAVHYEMDSDTTNSGPYRMDEIVNVLVPRLADRRDHWGNV